MIHKKISKLSLLAGLAGLTMMAGRAQTYTPPVAATSSNTTIYSNGNATLAIAADAAGNLFFTQPGAGNFVEDPAGGGAQITLIAGSLSYPKGVAVDNAGYAYTTDYHGHLWQVPAGGGTAVDVLNPCGPLDGYYLGTQAVAVDGSRNVYTAGNNETKLFEITPGGVCTVVAGVTTDGNTHVAADAAGDLAYSTGGVLYSLPFGAAAPVAVAYTFDSINGLRSDNFGNVFVSTNSTITEVPFINGALSGAQAFVLLPFSSAYDIGIAPNGTLYTTSDGTHILQVYSGSLHFPATAVGTTSTTGTATVVFNAAETLTGIRYEAGSGTSTEIANTGGTCAVGTAYAAGNSCYVLLTETPSTIGIRNGEVVFSSATGDLGKIQVSIQGSGAGLVADPATQTTLSSGFTAPDGIAVDASGGIAVSDKTAGTVSYFGPGATTSTVVATGLTQPDGVAIGPDGTIYVANQGGNNVTEIPFTGAAYGAAVTAVTGLNAPSAVAISNAGDLYIANTGAGTVLRVPNEGGTLNVQEMAAVSSGFTAPDGLAFDPTGDLFIADSSAGTVTEVSALGNSSAIASGLTTPGALAVDDSGTLYVQEAGVATILRIPFSSGAFNSNATTTLGTGLTTPASIALDSLGDLYVADSGAPAVVELQRTVGDLNFGRVNVASTSASESEVLSDDGDLSTTFGAPLYSASGDTGDFAIATTGTNGCGAGGTLIEGASCTVSATFTPTAQGAREEALSFTSNAAPITVDLTGTGVNLTPTTTTLTQVSPTGTVTFGQPVTVTATVSATSGTPTGTVQFAVNGVNSGNPVELTNGSASITLTGLASGSNTVSATYSGDNNFASSTATPPLTVVVVPASTTTVLTASVSASTPVLPGTSVTLTATVTSTLQTPKPTGTVTFSTGSTVLATEPLNSSGVATLTTTALPTGTYYITATYNGDSGFSGSVSNSVEVAILPAGYVITGAPTALTVAAPGSVSTSFLVTPISGYIGGIDMSCSGLPANTQCSFAPAVVYFGATTTPPITIALTITTDKRPPTSVAGYLVPLAGLLLLGFSGLRRRLPKRGLLAAVLLVFASAAVVGVSGCGSSLPTTPTGTSTVTVNFIGTPSGTTTPPANGAGNIDNSFSFSLTVK